MDLARIWVLGGLWLHGLELWDLGLWVLGVPGLAWISAAHLVSLFPI